MKYLQDKQGVSPVIGIILMVAVTVALVALAANLVFDLGGDVSETPDATVDLEQDGDDLTATVVRNENVETMEMSIPDGEDTVTESIDPADPGESGNINVDEDEDGGDAEGTLTLTAELSDGSEEVIRTFDYDTSD